MAQPLSDAARPVTVLIAEDEELVRELIARVLWAEGYRTLEARDGAEALHLAHLAGTHLDLVITDVIMPTVDGRELGRRLAGTYPGLPVLYISGFYEGDVFNRDGPGTAAPFLRKPFETDALLEKVRSLLSPEARPRTA